jgi:hypothetical protein
MYEAKHNISNDALLIEMDGKFGSTKSGTALYL